MSLLGIVAGGAVQAGLSGVSNFFGAESAKEARRENYNYNEMAANNADQRTRALYNDIYSPGAQLQQLEAAGMSPSVFYQGSGSQGTSGAQGQGTAGLSTPYSPMSMIEGAQAANLIAQTEKTKAETENINANTKTINGENERGLAEIATLWAEKGNKEANTALLNINKELNNWELEFKDDNLQFFSSEIRKRCELLDAQIQNYQEATKGQSISNEINEDTKEVQKQQFSATMANTIADTYLKYAQTALAQSNVRLNAAQEQYLKASIQLKSQELSIKCAELNFQYDKLNAEIEQFNTTIDTELQKFAINTQVEYKKIRAAMGAAGLKACTDLIGSFLHLGGTIFTATH